MDKAAWKIQEKYTVFRFFIDLINMIPSVNFQFNIDKMHIHGVEFIYKRIARRNLMQRESTKDHLRHTNPPPLYLYILYRFICKPGTCVVSAGQFPLIFIPGFLTPVVLSCQQLTAPPAPTLIIEPFRPPEHPNPIPVNQFDGIMLISSTSSARFFCSLFQLFQHGARR